MTFPDISRLAISGAESPLPMANGSEHEEDPFIQKHNAYAKTLPYPIDPPANMMELLDLILLRIAQCVEAKDYDTGLLQWDSMLT